MTKGHLLCHCWHYGFRTFNGKSWNGKMNLSIFVAEGEKSRSFRPLKVFHWEKLNTFYRKALWRTKFDICYCIRVYVIIKFISLLFFKNTFMQRCLILLKPVVFIILYLLRKLVSDRLPTHHNVKFGLRTNASEIEVNI